jgi:uncharacterized protein (TIGR00375 family)
MKVFAYLHIHSKYARATSDKMDLENLARYGKIKGLDIIGTGDFSHPEWFNDIKSKLIPISDSGLYQYKEMKFMLTTEINTIYDQDNQTRKVHHVLHAPSLEIVEQINEEFKKMGGDLGTDGRLILTKSSPEVVERLVNISEDLLIVPAHVWTPWFGCLGSKSGFDSIEDCYQDQTKHIHALETGLSSDPSMNWRLSILDKFSLLSNSDSHSPWPWRLGRECNVFELNEISYSEILTAVKKKDRKKFLFTIEVDPAYGKYHWTGHRKCGVRMSPKQALKFNNMCPNCGRKLTIGVEQRVEELSDRPEDFLPEDRIPFKKLIPLSELIKTVTGIKSLYAKTIWERYNQLVKNFEDEFKILLEASREDLEKITDKKLVDLIMLNREQKVQIIPGYDGVYGKPVFGENKEIKNLGQKSLSDFN